MEEQDHIIASPQLAGSIPMGRGLMPEELADLKAKGREWSRLFKEKRRKDFTIEQVEEKKLKNRYSPYAASRICYQPTTGNR